LARLADKYKHTYLIISGRFDDLKDSQINHHAVLGMMASLAVKNQAQVLMVDNDEECAYLISRIFEKHKDLKMVCNCAVMQGVEWCKTSVSLNKERFVKGKKYKYCDKCQEVIDNS
jgi:ERCC4-type nuclease